MGGTLLQQREVCGDEVIRRGRNCVELEEMRWMEDGVEAEGKRGAEEEEEELDVLPFSS